MSFKHKRSHFIALLVAVGILAVMACDLPLRPPGTTVDQLVISPKAVDAQPNQDVALMAVALTTQGDTAQISVTWAASDGTIGNYSDNGGRHYAHYGNANTGTFKVWATSNPGGKSDTATITVTPAVPVPVASVTVTPPTASVDEGTTVQLTATPLDANGGALSGRTMSWSTSAASVATVSSSGLVTGVAAGSATITATSEGTSGTAAITVTQVPVASVSVSPATGLVQVGQTLQLTATPKDASGNPLSGRTVTWTSTDSALAKVNGSGLVTGVAAGSVTISATSEGKSGTAPVTVTAPQQGGTPDPTLLPVATTAQVPLTAAYDALNVPGLAAGTSYADPTTGVKVYKITSGTFPTSASSWYHDYAEGGDEVSLPYNGNTRAVLVNGNGYWLVDFTPGVGVGNARRLTGSLTPCHDQSFAFSSNPATPYYAYVSNCSSVQRIDIRTMTAAPGNGWPVNNETQAVWLQQSENDAFFTWMRGQSGPVVVGYEPSSGTLKTQTVSNVDQPEINRNGSVRQVAINTTPQEGLLLWDFTQNAIICTAPGDPDPQFNHMGALRDRWIGMNWNTSAPHNYHQFLTDCSTQNLGSPASGNNYYANGSWNQHPASLDDQWAIFSLQRGLVPPGSGYLAPGGMIYVTANGQRRLLGHTYNTSTNYTTYSFARQSADGRYVMFTSDMHGSPRSDVFLAEVPVR
jgi:uncharacterized protein YjdB